MNTVGPSCAPAGLVIAASRTPDKRRAVASTDLDIVQVVAHIER
jgi:hypothetical protein